MSRILNDQRFVFFLLHDTGIIFCAVRVLWAIVIQGRRQAQAWAPCSILNSRENMESGDWWLSLSVKWYIPHHAVIPVILNCKLSLHWLWASYFSHKSMSPACSSADVSHTSVVMTEEISLEPVVPNHLMWTFLKWHKVEQKMIWTEICDALFSAPGAFQTSSFSSV